ncbi:MAG: hypothetical protein VX699_05275 [Myxococcota bacterium]|nr:hypothetical protein [Myxococcota bacterium]
MMRALVIALVGCVVLACEGGPLASLGQEPAIDAEALDEMRYPGEIVLPKDIYKEAYQRALKNITPDNLEDRLSMLEDEIGSGEQ